MQQLLQQLAQATDNIARHKNELGMDTQKLSKREAQFSRSTPTMTRTNKLAGRCLATSWIVQRENFVRSMNDDNACFKAVSYLLGLAHEWWRVYTSSGDGSKAQRQSGLRSVLSCFFDTFNKPEAVGDTLPK